MPKTFNLKKEYLAFAVFAVLVASFYGNTLWNGFIHDDIPVIVENPYVHDLRYIPKIVTGCIWESVLGSCKGTTLHYRPIQNLVLLLSWQVTSSPWFFHLVNLLFFFAAVSLVFVLAKMITGKFIPAFVAALLFLIYPIQAENVNWIVSITDLALTVFVLLAAINYLKYREQNSSYHFTLAVFFFFLGLLSKEAALLLPVIFLSIDFLLFRRRLREIFSWQEIKKYMLLAVPVLVYFLMRTIALGGIAGFYPGSGSSLGTYSFAERIYTYFGLFTGYLQKIFFPYPVPMFFLTFFHIKADLQSIAFIASVAVFVLYCLVIIFSIKKNKIVAFCLIWFMAFILIPIIFFKIVGEQVLAERYLLLPSVGFALIFGYLLNYVWEWKKLFRPILMVLIIILTAGSWFLIFPSNKLWKDNITLFKSVLSRNPSAYPARLILSNYYSAAGDVESAREQWEYLIANEPDWASIDQVYNSLGQYYRDKGDTDKAREYFEKAITAAEQNKTYNYRGYNNLGALYLEQKAYLKALPPLCRAIQMNPAAPEPRHNFDNILAMTQSVGDEDFLYFYMDVLQGGAFQKSSDQKIVFKRKFCAYDTCSFVFSPQLSKEDMLFPSLIMAKAFPEEIIRVKNASYNPETGEITLELNQQYQDRVVTFYFPSCDGVYYEATVELGRQI